MARFDADVGSVARRLWGAACSARTRFGLFVLFVVGVLAYGGALAWYTLERFDLLNMVRDGYRDDAFYYFQIAYHMAEGRFSTFDGFTRTNGYHPLWLFLITPFYWVFDKVEALFAIKALEIMLTAAGMALVAAAARAARLPWILLFAALPALYAQAGMRLGMEAALVLFMLGLLMLAMCLFARDPPRWRWLLAATAFALPWVRLEHAAVAVAATAAMGVLEWSGRLPSAPAAAGKRGGLKIVVPLATAFAGMLVYFVYNGVVFGSVLPVSAVVKQRWSERLWNKEGGYSVLGNLGDLVASDPTSPMLNAFDDELWIVFEVGVYALLVWWLSRRSGAASTVQSSPPQLAFMLGAFALAMGHLAKLAQSVLTVHPRWAYFHWYFVPAFLMEALVVPARCYVAICAVQRFVASRRVQAVLRLSIVACGLIALAAKTDLGAPFRFVDASREQEETTVHSWRVANYLGTLAMNQLLPEDSVVGSWSSGVVGYFSHLTVVNLDGLANSYDYLSVKRTETLESVPQRLGLRFTHFANMLPLGETTFRLASPRPEPPASPLLSAMMSPSKVQDELIFQIAAAEPAERHEESGAVDQAGSFWERIRPHRRVDDIALVLHGRVALAFRPDCAAEEVAEWSWDAVESRYASPWVRTEIGVCVTAIVLPSALPPVQVETMTVDGWLAERHARASARFRADFDVALVENRLFFMKAACTPGDIDAVFFLHVVPADTDDLPLDRQQHGYDNLDFEFGDHVHWLNGYGGWCVAEVQLPNYGMAAIRAGQYVVEEEAMPRIWEGEVLLEP